jgi:hypothetical protein
MVVTTRRQPGLREFCGGRNLPSHRTGAYLALAIDLLFSGDELSIKVAYIAAREIIEELMSI